MAPGWRACVCTHTRPPTPRGSIVSGGRQITLISARQYSYGSDGNGDGMSTSGSYLRASFRRSFLRVCSRRIRRSMQVSPVPPLSPSIQTLEYRFFERYWYLHVWFENGEFTDPFLGACSLKDRCKCRTFVSTVFWCVVGLFGNHGDNLELNYDVG